MNIVFDLDGTLIDSAPDIQWVASTILSGLGKNSLSLEETRSFIGEGAAVFVQQMMTARDLEYTPKNHAALLEKFYPGAHEVLIRLKDTGHTLGLCTNKPELPARAVIRHMGMESIFDTVMAGGMIDSHKPEPAMLLQTIEELGGGATLYVGDSEIDAQTAKRAAVPFALYSEGYRKTPVSDIHHDWVFNDFSALVEIVENIA